MCAAMEDHPRGSLPSSLKGLIRVCQCLGLVCFQRSPSPTVPNAININMPLLLWAIFLKTFQVTLIASVAYNIQFDKVGELASNLFSILSFACTAMGQISLIIKGPILCQILSDCEVDTCPEVRLFSTGKIMTLFFYLSNMIQIFLSILAIFNSQGFTSMCLYYINFCHSITSHVVIVMLFRMLLTIAASKLSVDFVRLDKYFSGTGSHPHLDALEKRIHKVEALRDDIVDCFLTMIFIMMCILTFNIITTLYIVIEYLIGSSKTWDIQFLSFVLSGITTLVHICYSAHYFSQHVRRVSTQLREVRLEVRCQEDKIQLQYLISTLERMETFDMGSWFCLSPNTLVSVTTYVVTYIVLLMQVGKQQV